MDEFVKGENGILLINEFKDLDYLLNLVSEDRNKTFIATWSISETPIEIRSSLNKHYKYFNQILIAYQKEFGGINNLEYFNLLSANFDGFDWQTMPLKHIKGNNYYHFGIKKDQ